MLPNIHIRRVISVAAISATAIGTTLALAPAAHASPSSVTEDTASVHGVVYATIQHGDRIYIGGEFDFAGRWSGAGQLVNPTDGRVSTPALRVVGQVDVAIPDGIGGWFLGGSFTQVLGAKRFGLARVTKAGKISPLRADVTGSVNALAYSGGTLYVGGSFNSIGGQTRNNLAAVNVGTNSVTSWAPNAPGAVSALELSGSGTVYAGGSLGLSEVDLASGSTTAWAPNVTGQVNAVERTGSTVYIGGDFSAAGGAARTDLAALDATTGTATSWAPSTDGVVNDITLRSGDDRLFIGGSFGTVSGSARQNLAAVATNGTADAWQADTDGEVFDLEVNPAGEVMAVGSFTEVDGANRLRGASVTSTGDLGAWDPATDATIRTAAVSTAKDATNTIVSKVLLGGNFTYVNGAPRKNIAAIDVATGDLVRTFVADTDAIVKALAISGDGSRLFVGGGFMTVNGAFRNRLAALDPQTGALQTWSANATGPVNGLAVNGDNLYVGGGFGAIGGEGAMDRLARVSVSTSAVDTSFDPNPGGTVRAVEVTNDGSKIFAVGTFTTFAGQQRPGAAMVNTNGTLNTWAPTEGGSSIAADLSPDQNRFYFSTSKNRMFAYDFGTANGNTPTWISRTGGDVQAIAATSTEVYVGGHFRNFPDQHLARPHLASVYVADGMPTPWSPGANGDFGVWSITATADSLLIGGDFDRAGGRRQPGFARFSGTP